MVILCIWVAVTFVAGWIWRLYHATGDGRLFNYPLHLSSSFRCTLSTSQTFRIGVLPHPLRSYGHQAIQGDSPRLFPQSRPTRHRQRTERVARIGPPASADLERPAFSEADEHLLQ